MSPTRLRLVAALSTNGRTLAFLALAWLLLVIGAYQSPAPLAFDIGSGADTPFVRGMSFRETSSEGYFRWTLGHGEIRWWGVGSMDGVLSLRLAAPRPKGRPRASVFANGEKLGDLVLTSNMQDYVFPITRSQIGPEGNLMVTLESDTFTQPPDDRTLGLQLDQVAFVPRNGLTFPAPLPALYLFALGLVSAWVTHLWTRRTRAAAVGGFCALAAGAAGLAFARAAAAWFLGPLVWTVLVAVILSLALARLLHWTAGQGAEPDRPLRALPLRSIWLAMALAFAVRMIWATGPGYIVDVQDYIVWSYKLTLYGLSTAYIPFKGLWIADQSPVLLYVVNALGELYRLVFSPDFLYPGVAGDPALRALTTNPAALADPIHRTLLRIPALLCDSVTGAFVLALVWSRMSRAGAWLVALAYWFNPAVLWNGAYWGQTDAVHTLLIVAAFVLVQARRAGLAFFLVGIALMTKPQAAVFGPILLLLVWRDLQWRGVLRAALGGALGVALALAPMLLAGAGPSMLGYFLDTVGHHPILSANAHNVWWLVMRGSIDVPDTLPVSSAVPWLSYRAFSLVLFGLVYAAILFKLWRAPRGAQWGLAAAAAFAFFMLPTEIHENYGFAALALLAIAIPSSPRVLTAVFLILTLTMTFNYALYDPGVYAALHLTDPDTELAAARLANSALDVILFCAWTWYSLTQKWPLARVADAAPAPSAVQSMPEAGK